MSKVKSRKASPAPVTDEDRTLRLSDDGTRPRKATMAAHAVSPHITSALIVSSFAPDLFKHETGITELVDELKGQVEAVRGGSLDRIEAMLIAQAHSLDMIFAELARRAALNMGSYIEAAERYMKLALRAQAQCRATGETLAAIKNPPNVAFVRQANIAHGPQQVNNGIPAARAGENPNPPNELLGNDHGERLDTGTTGTAGAGDPVMATVGTSDRTANCGREGDR